MYGLERSTGWARWKVHVSGGIAAQVLRHRDVALTVALGGTVRAVELASGRPIWQTEGPEGVAGTYSGDPTIHDGNLFVAWRRGWMDSVDAATGEVLWRRRIDATLNTSAALFRGEIVVGTLAGRIIRFDPETGAVLGGFDPGQKGGAFYGDLVPAEGCLLALQASSATNDLPELAAPHSLLCMEPARRRIRWQIDVTAPWSSLRPLVWDGTVIIGHAGEVRAVDLATGAIRRSWSIDGTPRGLGGSDAYLLVGTREGELLALPWTGKEGDSLATP